MQYTKPPLFALNSIATHTASVNLAVFVENYEDDLVKGDLEAYQCALLNSVADTLLFQNTIEKLTIIL